jgi:hypothetical protein
MSKNDYILEAVKGEPNSLTSIAFNTGVIAERQRAIRIIETHLDEETAAELVFLLRDRNVL